MLYVNINAQRVKIDNEEQAILSSHMHPIIIIQEKKNGVLSLISDNISIEDKLCKKCRLKWIFTTKQNSKKLTMSAMMVIPNATKYCTIINKIKTKVSNDYNHFTKSVNEILINRI